VAFKVLRSKDAFWRPSNQMQVQNTDLGVQLEADAIRARFWRLRPGEASTKHRHETQEELYVVLEGTGRMRVGEELLTLEPHSSVIVSPDEIRQIFNDTEAESLWLIAGAPPEAVTSTVEMDEETLAKRYPDGTKALPPELEGDQA
jgi:mannose-6-phosphate isomerase-like protein (cupin superfamily)